MVSCPVKATFVSATELSSPDNCALLSKKTACRYPGIEAYCKEGFVDGDRKMACQPHCCYD